MLYLYFIFIGAFIGSMGSEEASAAISDKANAIAAFSCPDGDSTNCNATSPALVVFQSSNIKDYLLAYHFFGFLWTNQFIIGIGMVVISGAVARWYFLEDKSTMSKTPVWDSVKLTLWYVPMNESFDVLLTDGPSCSGTTWAPSLSDHC